MEQKDFAPDSAKSEKLYTQVYRPDTLFILHCEFSCQRGSLATPNLLDFHQKSKARKQPVFAVVMDGGFSAFYPWFPGIVQ
jgi:hypothetical protein